MGRYYRLSKKITDDMATAILNEINEPLCVRIVVSEAK